MQYPMRQFPLIKARIESDPKVGKKSIILFYKDSRKTIEIRISPLFGSNIYKFKFNDYDIFDCNYKKLKRRDWTGCFILWPIPNRVRNKKFEFEGKIYDLKDITRKSGNSPLIHGLVDDIPWQIGEIKANKNSIRASTFIYVLPGTKIYKYFPFKSRLLLEFTLSQEGLKIAYTVHNLSKTNLPFGFALHPYFPISRDEKTSIFLSTASIMESDKELLPTGKLINIKKTDFNLNKGLPITKLKLDHVFTDLDRSKEPYIDYAEKKIRVLFETSSDFTHAVLYTKQKSYFCLENQTGSTDMINLYTRGIKENNPNLIKAAHLLILKPGKQHSGFVHYKIKKY